MDMRKIAIARQGGGIHGAFTCGVLNGILKAKEDKEKGIGDARSRRRFENLRVEGAHRRADRQPRPRFQVQPRSCLRIGSPQTRRPTGG
jgi:hypothetical protein